MSVGDKQIYTTPDMCRIFGFCTETVLKYSANGFLPAPIIRGPGRWAWSKAAVDVFLNQQSPIPIHTAATHQPNVKTAALR